MLRSMERVVDELEGIDVRENDISKRFQRPRLGNPSYVKVTGKAEFPCFGVLKMEDDCARTMKTLSGTYSTKWLVYYGNSENPILACNGGDDGFIGVSNAVDARMFFQLSDVVNVKSIDVRDAAFQIHPLDRMSHDDMWLSFDKRCVNIQ